MDWVKHSHYPRQGSSINYRLQHVLESPIGYTFIVSFEGQLCDMDINRCVQNTFTPLDLVWHIPILIMKQTMSGEAVDWSSQRCPTDSCQILVIPAESGGIRRNQIWQRHQPK